MILVDYRVGSGSDRRSKSGDYTDVVNYPPLNSCLTCSGTFSFTTTGKWLCSSGQSSHISLSTITTLEYGDICIPGNGPSGPVTIGVEVKSLSDLISSCDTGRLQARQLPGMLREYDISYLLYYGAYRSCPSTGRLQIIRGKGWCDYTLGTRTVPYSYLESMLLTLSCAGYRIKYIPHARRADSLLDCAQWISSLAKWWGKPWNKHSGLRTFDNSSTFDSPTAISLLPMPSTDAQMTQAQIAGRLPGMGYERGTAAARHFPSILEMISASEEEWAEVKVGNRRLGPALAKSIVEIVRRCHKVDPAPAHGSIAGKTSTRK